MRKRGNVAEKESLSARIQDIVSVLCAAIAILFAMWSYVVWSSGVIRAADESPTPQEEHYSPDPREMRDIRATYTPEMLAAWTRPEGPLRVGIQAGHWRVEEVPDELSNLRQNGAGGVWGELNERDIVLPIARAVVELLQADGIEAEVLPVTVPPGYIADAFVSLHADTNGNPGATGYKAAAPRDDYSGQGGALTAMLNDAYSAATDLPRDSAITWHMTGYYAFNWRRFEHAIHPMTPASILELGYMTNERDRRLLIEEPDRIAEGVAQGIRAYLFAEKEE